MRLNHVRLREAAALSREESAEIADEIERLFDEVAAWRKTFPMHQYSAALNCILSAEPFRRAPRSPQG